jgi:hypothetical protein
MEKFHNLVKNIPEKKKQKKQNCDFKDFFTIIFHKRN